MATTYPTKNLTGCYQLTTGTGRRFVLLGLGDQQVEIWSLEAWEAYQNRVIFGDDDPEGKELMEISEPFLKQLRLLDGLG